MIVRLTEGILHTRYGPFKEVLYYDGRAEAIALVKGDIGDGRNILCRVHSSCISAHVFNSIECDCREQMEAAQEAIEGESRGVIVWLDQEGKGNGHLALLATASLREQGVGQTAAYERLGFTADARDYLRAAEILMDLGVKSVILLTNNPDKANSLAEHGVKVTSLLSLTVDAGGNRRLRFTYKDKIKRGHTIELPDEEQCSFSFMDPLE